MRKLGVIVGVAVVGTCVMMACSSSDDAAPPSTPQAEAGGDAPITPPPAEGGVDGGTADAGGLQHSGTRIKLQGVETSEGTFLYDAPFDSKLGSVCYPARTEDGVLRCIPSVQASVTTFADASCTMPLANTTKNSCATKPTLGVRYISSATDHCDTRYAVYTLGALVNVAKVYTMNVGVGCVQYDASADQDYYAVAAPIAATDLVTFTDGIAPLTPDLGAYVVDGDDGSRIQRDYFSDVKRGKACDPNLAGDDQVRCTPRSKATAGVFSDMACSANAAVAAECVVPYETFDETTATVFSLGNCARNKVRAFPLGAKRATQDVFDSDNDGGCLGPQQGPKRDVYDVGAEIAPATMPAMVPSTAGGPRVVEGTLVSGGVVAQHDSFSRSDTMLGTACHFATAADGKLRCLPNGIDAIFFTDDKCTLPLGVQVQDCGPVKYVLRSDLGSCGTQHVHLAGTKVDIATPVWQQTGPNAADCLQVGGSNSIAYYTLGAEVSAATFEEGTVVTK